MDYLALHFEVSADAAEAWSDALLAAGAMSIDVSDPRVGTPDETPLYGEPGEPGVALWPEARVVALFASSVDVARALTVAARELGVAAPPSGTYAVAEQDWVRATQAQFGPIQVAPGMWIVPSWSQAPDPAAQNLALDPGLAFGTGSHPTTRLCLQWLQAELRAGQTVLDYGCGSGILGIAAAKLGALEVTGTDVDPQAITASTANAQRNGVRASFVLPDALRAGAFDVVVANILANPLTLLAPALAARVRPGGRIALSGILVAQAAGVAAAYSSWFTIGPWRSDDGWVLLAGERVR
jgi:ribosomal protein L11 methyltransferase